MLFLDTQDRSGASIGASICYIFILKSKFDFEVIIFNLTDSLHFTKNRWYDKYDIVLYFTLYMTKVIILYYFSIIFSPTLNLNFMLYYKYNTSFYTKSVHGSSRAEFWRKRAELLFFFSYEPSQASLLNENLVRVRAR